MTVNPFRGTWRIVSMEGWDQDYVDMEVPAYIAFEKNGLGDFQFGLAQGQTDYRINGNRVEFTWSGVDENDEVISAAHKRLQPRSRTVSARDERYLS